MNVAMGNIPSFKYDSDVVDVTKLSVDQINFVKEKTKGGYIFENHIVDHLVQNNQVWVLFWWLGYYGETVEMDFEGEKFDFHLGRATKFVEQCTIADLQADWVKLVKPIKVEKVEINFDFLCSSHIDFAWDQMVTCFHFEYCLTNYLFQMDAVWYLFQWLAVRNRFKDEKTPMPVFASPRIL